MNEKILDCKCHKVNNLGEVYSCIKQTSKKGVEGFITYKSNKWQKLKGRKNKNGYIIHKIHGKQLSLHRLVAENFCYKKEMCHYVLHNDGNKNNNQAENLRWGTAKENQDDRKRHGTHARGTYFGKKPKLTEELAMQIFCTFGKQRDVAKQFGVSQRTVATIKNKVTWKHIHTSQS